MYVGSTVYLVTRYTNPTVAITMWWFCFRSNAGQYLSLYDNVMPAGLELWQFLCCNIQLWIWPVIWWGHPIQVRHQRRVQSATFCLKIGIFFPSESNSSGTFLWSLWEIRRVEHVKVQWDPTEQVLPEMNTLMSLSFLFFCCSSCRQHNKHLDHTYLISVSVKSRSRLPSARISKQVGLRGPTWKMHQAHTFHARIPYCSILDAFPSSGCFILDESSTRVQHVSASWTLLKLFGRIFPNQRLPQQWSLAVRDRAALQHRHRISVPINNRQDIFISRGPQLICTTCTGPGVWYLRRVELVFQSSHYTADTPNTHVCSCFIFY